jgi:hypothetical protein
MEELNMRSRFSILAMVACGALAAAPLFGADASSATSKKSAAVRSAWSAESLSGTITMGDAARKTVVVQTPGGVPFDMVITRNTRIKSGDRAITLQDLPKDVNRGVSVKFVPERRGDIATTIQLNG